MLARNRICGGWIHPVTGGDAAKYSAAIIGRIDETELAGYELWRAIPRQQFGLKILFKFSNTDDIILDTIVRTKTADVGLGFMSIIFNIYICRSKDDL